MGKIGLRLKICLWLLVLVAVASAIFGLLHVARQGKPPTLGASILLMLVSVVATAVITWIFSRRLVSEEVKRADKRAVRVIQKSEEDATGLLNQTRREAARASRDLGDSEQVKSLILHFFLSKYR